MALGVGVLVEGAEGEEKRIQRRPQKLREGDRKESLAEIFLCLYLDWPYGDAINTLDTGGAGCSMNFQDAPPWYWLPGVHVLMWSSPKLGRVDLGNQWILWKWSSLPSEGR